MSARLTPYELAFGPPEYERDVFPEIRDELRATGRAAPDPDAFLRLESVGRAMRALGDEAAPSVPDALEMRQHARLLFQGFRFWDASRPFWVLGDATTRRLLTSTTIVGDWRFTPPADAGYVQFARHLIWARTAEDAPAEPVDGAFWAMSRRDARAAEARMDILLVLGMHPDRPGFSAVDVTGWLPGRPPGHWADSTVRAGEQDFANVLPGGDLRGLFSLTSGEEVLKLLSRVFHFLAVHTEAVAEPGVDLDATAGSRLELPPSGLPARIVSTDAEPGEEGGRQE